MKFFVPNTTDAQEAEKVWQATKTLAMQTMGWKVGDRRIFRITYRHAGECYHAEVGKTQKREDKFGRPRPLGGEMVYVILESNAYLVCTPTRGISGGMPLLVGQEELILAEDFEI